MFVQLYLRMTKIGHEQFVQLETHKPTCLSLSFFSFLFCLHSETYFVENRVDANNLAYASSALSLHTDLPYLHHEPGVCKVRMHAQSFFVYTSITGQPLSSGFVQFFFRKAQQRRLPVCENNRPTRRSVIQSKSRMCTLRHASDCFFKFCSTFGIFR